MIETHFWEQLAAISKYETLSAASEHLHLTQPALSRSMKKLETLLGITLFEHGKNKIALNDTGKMAAEQACKILEYEKDIIHKIKTYDKSLHTLTIGSCAPAPLRELSLQFMEQYSTQSISSEIAEEASLLQKLRDNECQIIVLTHPIEDSCYFCNKLTTEQIYFAVTKLNPLADKKAVSFRDIDGQTILLYQKIGFWYDLCYHKLTHSRMLLQNDFSTFQELVAASEFPFFISDWHLKHSPAPENRIYIPVSDSEASVTYYCICKQSAKKYLQTLQ